jgi:hypothetical protein
MATGAVQTEPLVSGQLPITAWRDAFDDFERRVGLKTVLYPVEEVSA